jgi:hypothetical protein
MKFFRTLFLISVGGCLDAWFGHSTGNPNGDLPVWLTALCLSGGGWAWLTIGAGIQTAYRRLLYALAGKPVPMPETDPKALAAEIRALNSQLSQLRDTATSFDVSFDQTLERLNDRLCRLEQQSAYVQMRHQA